MGALQPDEGVEVLGYGGRGHRDTIQITACDAAQPRELCLRKCFMQNIIARPLALTKSLFDLPQTTVVSNHFAHRLLRVGDVTAEASPSRIVIRLVPTNFSRFRTVAVGGSAISV